MTNLMLKGAVPLESKHLFYWEVNFVYILNNLPAANDTENVNEVSGVNANFWQMVGQSYRLQSDHDQICQVLLFHNK